MHELAFAYMVVAHSRRDPGEYQAELRRFAALPAGPLRAHALEAHLGRWPAALAALVAAGDAHGAAALQLAQDKVWSGRAEGSLGALSPCRHQGRVPGQASGVGVSGTPC
jgi:hypothetical protein